MIPKISIVLGTYNRLHFLKAAIESIRNNGITIPYECIVIDGGSTDGTHSWLCKQKDIISIIQYNHGKWKNKHINRHSWGYFMNKAFNATHGKYILMISDDCLLHPDAIMNGINFFEETLKINSKLGALAFFWRNWPEQQNYNVGFTFGKKIFVNHGLFLRSALLDVNWFDEVNFSFYHADGDICLKLWEKGYEILASPNSFVEHFVHTNLKNRRINLITQLQDWNYYSLKWKNKFEDFNDQENGGWIINMPTKKINLINKHRFLQFLIYKNIILQKSKSLLKKWMIKNSLTNL